MKQEILVHKAIQYAIDPESVTEDIRTFLMQSFGCVRKVYNLYVDSLYAHLEKTGYTGGAPLSDIPIPEITFWKKSFDYLKDPDSLALANAKIAFQNAVKRFNEEFDHTSYTKRALRKAKEGTEPLSFRGLRGMPKFHSIHQGYFSYTTNNQKTIAKDGSVHQTISLENDMLYLPKLKEGIRLILHRSFPEDAVIKNATIRMEPNGRLLASIGYETTQLIDLSIQDCVLHGHVDDLSFLGLDYSQPDFYVDSEGRKANCPPHAYKKLEAKIAKFQKQLSRMEYRSNNYNRKVRQINNVRRKERNRRKDFAHKESRKLVNHYDVIVVEDINLNNMGQSLRLGKNLHDNGFGMFRTFLDYKLKEKGSMLVKIDRSYPSTKRCSDCGYVNPGVTLGVQEWICPVCNAYHNRDENAAENIKGEGQRIASAYFRQQLQKAERQAQRAAALKYARMHKKKTATGIQPVA